MYIDYATAKPLTKVLRLPSIHIFFLLGLIMFVFVDLD